MAMGVITNAWSVSVHHLRDKSLILVINKEANENLRLSLLKNSTMYFQDVVEKADLVGVHSKGKKVWAILYQPKYKKLLGYYIVARKKKNALTSLTEIAHQVTSWKITRSPQHVQIDINNGIVAVQMKWNGRMAVFPDWQGPNSLNLMREPQRRSSRNRPPKNRGKTVNDENQVATASLPTTKATC